MSDHTPTGDFTPSIQFAADGKRTVFPCHFPLFYPADVQVFVDEVHLTAGYSVMVGGSSHGGEVAFDTPPAAGSVITLRRRLGQKAIFDELDYLCAALQQVAIDSNIRLTKLLAEAKEKVEAMTPEERAEMHEAQRRSWVRGEMALGPENGED